MILHTKSSLQILMEAVPPKYMKQPFGTLLNGFQKSGLIRQEQMGALWCKLVICLWPRICCSSLIASTVKSDIIMTMMDHKDELTCLNDNL